MENQQYTKRCENTWKILPGLLHVDTVLLSGCPQPCVIEEVEVEATLKVWSDMKPSERKQTALCG